MINENDITILIADDDKSICDITSKFLIKKGYKTITASNGAEALALFKNHKPHLAIVDIRMPIMKGLDFLREVRQFDSVTPIIITTGFPEMKTVLEAIRNGAFDYLTKPFPVEILQSKVSQALKTLSLIKENIALSELVTLHNISNTLANTHEVSEILEVTFEFCVATLNAEKAAIFLVDKDEKNIKIVKKKGFRKGKGTSSLSDITEWPVSKWVIENAKSLVVNKQIPVPATTLPKSKLAKGSIIAVPLKAAEEVIGVVYLVRSEKHIPFSEIDRNMLEVLASQAGTAISNANLYTSLKQKISELSLISNYSQHFIGLVDLEEVIKCLFETVQHYFSIDVIGFLVIRKRFHNFLYWSRGKLLKESIDEITLNTINEYNKATESNIEKKFVKPTSLQIPSRDTTVVKTPLLFEHIIPLVWQDFDFGALYFGAQKKPDNHEDKTALLTGIVGQTRIALISAKLYNDMKENYIRTIKALAIAVDAKDKYTHGHSENVMNIAEAIAEEMGIDKRTITTVRDGGLLHDIGKIGIPGYILNKPGPLTQEEFDGVMKTHCLLGANIVKDVPFLKELYSLILHHHEHYDGSGYPEGLKGENIPIGARIVHVADSFEAMTSNRPYRTGLDKHEAIKRIIKLKGKEFDPVIIEAFIRMVRKKGWYPEE